MLSVEVAVDLPDESDLIADRDPAGAADIGIQREPAFETTPDVLEDTGVDGQRVGVDGGHRTSTSAGVDADHGITDAEFAARPLNFIHPRNPADEDVGTQSTDVAPELGGRAVGGDEQGQNIEALDPFVGLGPRILAGRARAIRAATVTFPDAFSGFAPASSSDQGFSEKSIACSVPSSRVTTIR